MPKRIVIIGAGISGLATAYHLQEYLPQAEITILEAKSRVGGRIWTDRRDGYQAEEGDAGFHGYQPGVWKLCRKLGIAIDVIPPQPQNPNRYFLHEKKLYPIPQSTGAALRNPLLNWKDLWTIARERRRKTSPPQQDESVHDFLTRRFSGSLAEKFSELLVTDAFAADPRHLSMAACFPKYAQAEQEFGSVLYGFKKLSSLYEQERMAKGEAFPPSRSLLSFRLGMRVLIEAILSKLKNPPITDMPVENIHTAQEWDQHRWVVRCRGKEPWPADVLVLCCPAAKQAGMLADLDGDLADALLEIEYIPQVIVSLGYRKAQASAFTQCVGYTSRISEKRDVLSVNFDSSCYTKRAPEGHVLIRAIMGTALRKDIIAWDDDRVIQAARRELKGVARIKGPPTFVHVTRALHSLPLYKLGHFERVQDIDHMTEKHEGLYLSGNAFDGVTINDCVQQSRLTAYNIARFLSQHSGSI